MTTAIDTERPASLSKRFNQLRGHYRPDFARVPPRLNLVYSRLPLITNLHLGPTLGETKSIKLLLLTTSCQEKPDSVKLNKTLSVKDCFFVFFLLLVWDRSQAGVFDQTDKAMRRIISLLITAPYAPATAHLSPSSGGTEKGKKKKNQKQSRQNTSGILDMGGKKEEKKQEKLRRRNV